MMLEKAGEVCLTGTVWKGVVASVFCATAWLYLSGKTFESYLIAHMNPKDSYPRIVARMFDLIRYTTCYCCGNRRPVPTRFGIRR